MTWKVTPSTPLYAHVVLPCSCDSPMLMTFSKLIRGITIEDDDLRWKMAYIQNDGKELN